MRRSSFLLILILGFLAGCSSDSTAPNENPVPTDTTAPLVLSLNPDDLDNGVDLDEAVVIHFSEPMLESSLAPALEMTAGSVEDITWNAASTVATVTHTVWAEGTEVVVSVGTGVTDLAGNSLPISFHSTFYTFSNVPVMMGYNFFGPLDAVPLNGYLILQFSDPMDLDSVLAAATLTEDPVGKSVPGMIVGAMDGDYRRVRLRWDGALIALHHYHLTVGTGAMTQTGVHLSDGFTIDFTAGSELDETPPYILSTSPTLDSVVDPDLDHIIITFSEPIDLQYDSPNSMAAMIPLFMAREPVWNAAGDQLTVYMNGPLPKGIRYYAIWNAGELVDIAGNFNTSADSLSFSTSGESSLMPLRDDLKLYFHYSEDGGDIQLARCTLENISGDNFERILSGYSEKGFDQVLDHWYAAWAGGDLMLRGFQDDDGDMMFDPAVQYLPAALSQTWSGSSTFTGGDGLMNLTYSGTRNGTFRYRLDFDKVAADGLFLDNCIEMEILHTVIPEGASDPVETGSEYVAFCPGLGIIAMESETTEHAPGEADVTWESGYEFFTSATDDRYDTGDF